MYSWGVIRVLPCLLLVLLLARVVHAQPEAEPADPTEADLLAPATPAAPASPREKLQTAIACYQRSEFDQARELLLELAAAEEKQGSRTGMEALLYLGFVHVAYGEREAAQAAFQRALTLDPELSLPVRSPAIDAQFDQARRRFEARRRALDHDPPRLTHQPPGKAPHGKAVTIKVQAADPSGIKRVTLNHRLAGNRGFSSVDMERTAAGQGGGYVATIPGLAVSRPGVEYYVAAWDNLNNGPGLKGSAGAPIKVEVEGGPLREAPEPRQWYKKWWVWASVAGVVAIAGGVALGVYLDRDEVGRIDARLPAELDP